MSASVSLKLSAFAQDVAEGLCAVQKKIPPRYFYDELGSTLFEAITLLPEYGLTRADERLLRLHAGAIASKTAAVGVVSELGSGSGKKTKHILQALSKRGAKFTYGPIDVSSAALEVCERDLAETCEVRPICGDWMEGLSEVARARPVEAPLLLLFLGSSIGNLERGDIVEFLRSLRSYLRSGDFFLLGVDLVKPVESMLAAYDDPTRVTAAFNVNLLGRMNRELDADFDLRSFAHEVRWNSMERRIEMHLSSRYDQTVYVGALESAFTFEAGETIWTESSHKFTISELSDYAGASGFKTSEVWVDREWPFAEALWEAA